MEFYTIPPNSQLNLMHLGDRYFCLAQHYYTNEEYRKFFKEQVAAGKWVTLDNGAGDHALITEDILMWCVEDLMPSEVIPPDVLFDKDTTLKNLRLFIQRMDVKNLLDKVQIFACPQGKDRFDWIDCYIDMLNNEYVTTIGMSKLAIPHAFLGDASNDQGIMQARHICVDYLIDHSLIQKPLHFLGMGNPLEMAYYKGLDSKIKSLFRSTDSCNSIWSAMNNLDWSSNEFQRIRTPHDYFERNMTADEIWLAQSNIAWFRNLLS